MKIGVYIGSFNPPHLGHKKIVDYLLEKKFVDKVLIVPTKNYWDKKNLIDIKDRINMLKYYENDKVEVDTVHNSFSYTYELLNELSKMYQDDELYLIIGADNLEELHKWKNINELLKYNIIVMNRNSIKKNPYIDDRNIIYIEDFDNINISSTEIRNGDYSCLDSNVKDYIEKNKLYKEEKMDFKRVVEKLIEEKKTISTMESCTGGGVANAITNIEGASSVLKFSAVTYSNEFKMKMGVSKETIDNYSVYSMETAHEMAYNISMFTNSDYGIGITGKLNRADENNNYGEDNEVFISIFDKENQVFIDSDIKVTEGSRKLNKDVIINEIISSLSNVLGIKIKSGIKNK